MFVRELKERNIYYPYGSVYRFRPSVLTLIIASFKGDVIFHRINTLRDKEYEILDDLVTGAYNHLGDYGLDNKFENASIMQDAVDNLIACNTEVKLYV